ncbi:hypothetical protein [Geminisphaera colitermitum]|uniref:hypothetical protein n=1 Tax=Geminisphaera colitermitum TaxID=1148786 RepID=UPI0012FF51D1|nr:hypothetical protein [Geminisphaera colitermitum]
MLSFAFALFGLAFTHHHASAAADEVITPRTWTSGATTITGTNSVTTAGAVISQGTANVTLQSQGVIRLMPGFRASPASGGKFRATITTNQARFVSWSVPTELSPGEPRQVSVVLNNAGGNTWTSAAGYKLGSQSPTDNTRWNLSRVTLPATVQPGQNVTFTFNITAPFVADTHSFQWGMLQDGGAGWFGNFTPVQSICVRGRPQDDANNDGLSDIYTRDTNNNGIPDAIEISLGLDPATPSTNPSGRSDTFQYDKSQRLINGPGGAYSQDAEDNITGR